MKSERKAGIEAIASTLDFSLNSTGSHGRL